MESLDHRAYVGGLWEEIGRLQFEFLLRQGLAPSNCFLDIACGSLRGRVHFINFLSPGNYLGFEKQRRLAELGIETELGRAVLLKQKPEVIFSGDFEFHRFSKIPSYSIAQSLLTHLVPSAGTLGWKPTYIGDWQPSQKPDDDVFRSNIGPEFIPVQRVCHDHDADDSTRSGGNEGRSVLHKSGYGRMASPTHCPCSVRR